MNNLTKPALGTMGLLRRIPAQGDTLPKSALPAHQRDGGMPLMEALPTRGTRQATLRPVSQH